MPKYTVMIDGEPVEMEGVRESPGPVLVPKRTINKEQLVDRMSNEELEAFTAARDGWTLRQREKLHSLTHAVEGTPAWTLLATKLEAVFGRPRAIELLAAEKGEKP